MSDLGKLLRELRGDESLRKVADRAGISHNYLSIVEKGVDPRTGSPILPTPDTLKKLATAYGYPYEELLRVAGVIDEELKDELIKTKKLELIDKIDRLPEQKRRLVENLIESLSED